MKQRYMAAVLLAVTLALIGGCVRSRGMQVIPSICATLTPDNWFLWWWYGCSGDAAGGGGSGAG